VASISFPMQGLLNFMIYIYPRYIATRGTHPHRCCFYVLKEAVWNPSGSSNAASTRKSNRHMGLSRSIKRQGNNAVDHHRQQSELVVHAESVVIQFNPNTESKIVGESGSVVEYSHHGEMPESPMDSNAETNTTKCHEEEEENVDAAIEN
jgi:hypothetical protein